MFPVYITFDDGGTTTKYVEWLEPSMRILAATTQLMVPLDRVAIVTTLGRDGGVHYYRRDGAMFGAPLEVARA